MRLILKYATQLRKVSALLVSELEQIVERANSWSAVEHDGVGRHTDITATSIDVTDIEVTNLQFSTGQQTTVGAAGAASALPATPTGYQTILIADGTEVVIPYYAKS